MAISSGFRVPPPRHAADDAPADVRWLKQPIKYSLRADFSTALEVLPSIRVADATGKKKLRWDSVGVPAEAKRPCNYPLSTDNRYFQASEEENPQDRWLARAFS
jgi:hypothetical protein